MRVTALAVAAVLALTVATGCTGRPEHQSGAAVPAGSPAPSTTSTRTAAAPTETKSPSATTSTPANTTPARCRTDQLTGDIEQYEPPGQAGSAYQARVKLTNTGVRCTMSGYIDIRLLSNGQPRETTVTRSGRATETVTLDRGDSAWTKIVWVFVPGNNENSCDPRVTGARIVPPGGGGALEIDETLGQVCEHGGVLVSPVSASKP